MKRVYLVALLALIVLTAAAASVYAGSTCYARPGNPDICGSCPAGGYDRTPTCVYGNWYGRGPDTNCYATDPWTKCGAFCYAGQLPAGWRYGWDSEYWLRPDSNL
ncbi:MAG: hypothetical protein M1133_06950 [Armatimonadetes bacterium]|nr:hypothetical protein [Armatimonadota bacterium]